MGRKREDRRFIPLSPARGKALITFPLEEVLEFRNISLTTGYIGLYNRDHRIVPCKSFPLPSLI